MLTNTGDYVVANRPTMVGFNESPDGTITNFTAAVEPGTEIVFLNGMMQKVGDDYTVSIAYSEMNPLDIIFTSAPSSTDKVDVYGVPAGVEFNGLYGNGGAKGGNGN